MDNRAIENNIVAGMCLFDGHHYCEINFVSYGTFSVNISTKIPSILFIFVLYSISFAELYFLISKFLTNGPFKHVGEVKKKSTTFM